MTDALLPTSNGNNSYSIEKLLENQDILNPELFNDISKLMYYLNCVNIVIQVNIHNKYINYFKPNNISKEDEEIILNLAQKYKPKFFVDNGVFIINQGNSFNVFYQLNDERIKTKVNPNILIEGNVINVSQVMRVDFNFLS